MSEIRFEGRVATVIGAGAGLTAQTGTIPQRKWPNPIGGAFIRTGNKNRMAAKVLGTSLK